MTEAVAKDRVSDSELEILRRKIWVYRSRGMTIDQIAKAVHKSRSTVHHHLRELRKQTVEATENAGKQELVGELILAHRELRQEALRNMTSAEQGTLMRLNWIDVAARRLRDEAKFLMDIGFVPKAADKVDIQVRDVRNMSTEEIEREIQSLREELAYSQTAFAQKAAEGQDVKMIDAVVKDADENTLTM